MKALMSAHLFGVVVVSLLMGSSAWGTTIYWETPEEVITRASIIVYARVTTVETKEEIHQDRDPRRRYDEVTLEILDVLKGSAPSPLVIRRWGVIHGVPAYTPGEEIVLCVYKSPFGYYKPMGLLSGIFRLEHGRVAGSPATLAGLKQQIRELVAGQRSRLSPEVPRPRLPDDPEALNHWLSPDGALVSRYQGAVSGSADPHRP